MTDKPSWIFIEECNIWRTLGVIECDDCNSLIKCWGTDSQLPEPERTIEQQSHWEETLKALFSNNKKGG